MANIMKCIIGKDFGKPAWRMSFSSPFNKECNFTWEMNELSPPLPAKNFDYSELEAFRDYITSVIDEYDRIVAAMEELNE